jgi:hypothetical protein
MAIQRADESNQITAGRFASAIEREVRGSAGPKRWPEKPDDEPEELDLEDYQESAAEDSESDR